MTTIKVLIFLIIFFNQSWANAQAMKKINLPNGHEVYSLSAKEEASIKASLPNFTELRRDSVKDLIYKTDDPMILVLYKSQDGKLLFDYGQVKFLILLNEDSYDYYLNVERNYQAIHALDFIDLQAYNDFTASIDRLVDSFCERRIIPKNKLTYKILKNDIVSGGAQAISFLKEQVAVICFLKGKEGFKIEVLQLFGSDKLCSISMVGTGGNRITPSQLVAKMYDRSTFK